MAYGLGGRWFKGKSWFGKVVEPEGWFGEDLLKSGVAAPAVEQIPDRLRHQTYLAASSLPRGSVTSWGLTKETPVVPSPPAPHRISQAPSQLPQGDFSSWGQTRDTTPFTARVQHQVALALTPLPQGGFQSWAPPRVAVAVVVPTVKPHQIVLAEDLRRLQRFRLERHGGPAGFEEVPPEDTTKLYPHQVGLAPSRLPEGDFASWGLTRDTTPRTARVEHQTYLAQSRFPEGDFFSWTPPKPTPVAPSRGPDPQITLAPSRTPGGAFIQWRPPRLPQLFRLPPWQTIAPPEDPRRHQRFTIYQTGIGYTPPPPPPDVIPGCVAIADAPQGLALTDDSGGAVSLADGSGHGVSVAATTGQIVSVEDVGSDVEIDDGNPC